MYFNNNRKLRYDLTKLFDLRKILVCIVIIILVLFIKKVNVPFRDLTLGKIEYYLFSYSYDYNTLINAISEIPKKAESLSVFKQIGIQRMIFPVDGGEVISTFGKRMHPILKIERMHNGIDIAQEEGTPVKAVMDGLVISVGQDSELGKYIRLKHEDDLETVYGHLKDIYIKQNESVKQGLIIGTVGKTGLAEVPHLHFEVWENNIPKDPLKLLKLP